MAMLVFGSMFFTACEEEDNPITPDPKPTPTAPTNLRATSASATAVLLRWDKSVHEDSTWFAGYELTITGGTPMAPKAVSKTQPYEVTGLEAGVVYTFTLKAKNTEDVLSTGSTSVTWSPAARFETADIKMYEFDSQNGSGLSIYDATNKKPMNLKAADRTKWHLGFDSRSSKWNFGPAASISIGTGTPTATVEISDEYWEVDNMNTIFLPETAFPTKNDLSKMTFSAEAWDLKSLNAAKSVVFIVRVKEQGSNNWNYAKVLVEKAATGFLQGTAPNQYIQLKVSYQTAANVPYAKF